VLQADERGRDEQQRRGQQERGCDQDPSRSQALDGSRVLACDGSVTVPIACLRVVRRLAEARGDGQRLDRRIAGDQRRQGPVARGIGGPPQLTLARWPGRLGALGPRVKRACGEWAQVRRRRLFAPWWCAPARPLANRFGAVGVLADEQRDQLPAADLGAGARLLREHQPVIARGALARLDGRPQLEGAQPRDRVDRAQAGQRLKLAGAATGRGGGGRHSPA